MSSTEEKQQARDAELKKRLVRDWRRVLGLVEGRRVVWSLLRVCGHRKNAFVLNDSHATAYNCAMRALGNYIEDFVRKADPVVYEQMAQEAKAEEAQFKAELKNMEEEIYG